MRHSPVASLQGYVALRAGKALDVIDRVARPRDKLVRRYRQSATRASTCAEHPVTKKVKKPILLYAIVTARYRDTNEKYTSTIRIEFV